MPNPFDLITNVRVRSALPFGWSLSRRMPVFISLAIVESILAVVGTQVIQPNLFPQLIDIRGP
jgi:hypothetical protein